ncbi:MAG: 2-hydroxyacid dehydrogenase [Micrococcaceae bacterium]
MKITFFSAQPYDEAYFTKVAENDFKDYNFDLNFVSETLSKDIVEKAKGAGAVCAFVNDDLSGEILESLNKYGVKTILMRCAGFDRVDLDTAKKLDILVACVPAYSPEAIAEHAIALLLTLNRNTNRAFNRIQKNNFALDGLLGSNLYKKTAGVIGTGKIGLATARIFKGFGMEVIAYDPYPTDKFDEIGKYVELDELIERSDVISLHCPLTSDNHHIINANVLKKMKDTAFLINTSRGGLVDSEALLKALQNDEIAGAALDVYENEATLFFKDLSDQETSDDLLEQLNKLDNFLITGHQAFFTQEALTQISQITLGNLAAAIDGKEVENAVI